MASADREREEQLVEAGKRLLQPPSSVDELLLLLDRVENFLSRVEQSPSKSMLTALSPTMKALVADELLGHPNEDVRVAVASCISEITRITAPEAPYDDDRMKEVFQLIVSSFENLSDKSGRSYSKRTLILETVAKVRSCVVMLDLECDGLIVEMFQHFLKAIRDYHPENVFSSMETIMTLVLEESEDIALELISPILASLKKDNNEVQPIAQKLAEKVFGNCAAKVKPCLIHAKSSLNLSFDDYNTVISSICNGTSHGVGQDDHKASGKQTKEVMVDGASSEVAAQGEVNKSAVTSPVEAAQDPVTNETITETRNGQDNTALVETVHGDDHSAPAETGTGKDSHAPVEAGPGEDHPVPVETGPGEDHPASEMSSKSVTSNGVAETEKEESANPGSSEKLEQTNQDDQSLEPNVSGDAEPGDSVSGKIAKVESKSEQTSKKRSRKSKNSTDSAEPCDSSHLDTDKEAKRVTDGDRSLDKEVHASPSRDPSIEVAVSAENEKESDQISSPNTLDNEPKNVVSPSPSGHVLEDGRSRKTGRSKKKSNLIKKASPTDAATEKASEGTKNSEVKLRGRSGKKALTGDSLVENDNVQAKISKVEGGSASDSDAKVVEKSSKKADIKDHIGDESSSKKKDDGKRRVRGKTALEKETVSSPKHSKVVEDESPLGATLKISSKRRRTPAKEKGTDVKESGDDLVGSKIKVWWPMDKMYYDGVIKSFDSVNKRHTVLYIDGDLEVLDLKKEKWELVGGDDSVTDGERATKLGGPDTSPEIERKKRAKTGSEPSAKHGKTEGLRDGDASSSKSKGAATKSGHKSMDDTKVDGKLKDDTPKSSAKSEDGGKSKIRSKKNRRGKSAGDTSEKADKSKDEGGGTPKPSIKFKVGSPKIATKDSPKTAIKDTPKTNTKDTPKTNIKDTPKAGTKNTPKGGSKGKGSKSGGKSSAGKVKSGSIKLKETEGKEKSPEVVKTPESGKGKSTGTSKGKETDGKSGKKRRRGVKS